MGRIQCSEDILPKFFSKKENMPEEFAAVEILIEILTDDPTISTMQEFLRNVEAAQEKISEHTSRFAVGTCCEIFKRYITSEHSKLESLTDFEDCKKIFLEEGAKFLEDIKCQKDRTITQAQKIFDTNEVKMKTHGNQVNILTHSYSEIVLNTFIEAHKNKRKFKVYVTNGAPDNEGSIMVKRLREAGIPAVLVQDTALCYVMSKVHIVVVAAEGITLLAHALCKLGTLNLAVAAKQFIKEFYVIVESYKFAKFDIVSYKDIPRKYMYSPEVLGRKGNLEEESPLVDLTYENFIQKIFCDLGPLPPCAVNDFIIRDMYK